MKSLTLALLLTMQLGAISGAATSGATFPGGVAAPFFWSETGKEKQLVLSAKATEQLCIFAVYEVTPGREETVWSISDHDSSRQLLTNRRLLNLRDYQYVNFAEPNPCDGPTLRTYVREGGAAGARTVPEVLRLGYHAERPQLPTQAYTGSVLEVIVYDRQLSPDEHQRIESYLALRHGITLDQDVPRHYLSAGGDILWDAQRNRTHPHRIFEAGTGVSRECGGELLTGSLTGKATGVTSILSDNNLATALIDNRMERSWCVQTEWASPSAITLHPRPRHFFTQLPEGNVWELLVDTTGTGKFIAPLRIGEQSGNYRMPVLSERQHFTFSPALPVVTRSRSGKIRSVAISPNPTVDGHFQLRIELREAAPVQVDIFNTLGRLISTRPASQTAQGSAAECYHQLAAHLKTSGVHLIRISSGTETVTRKITVQ